jgi:predicted GIY-YIG superfamily endonuclease
MPRSRHPVIPNAPAIYLFSEGEMLLYVGQTRGLNRRLGEHTRPSSRQNQASFAFLIAVEQAERAGIALSGSRDDQERELGDRFTAAKQRVAEMDVRFVEMDDPIERTVFEMYAALHLGTERYNSFETH